MKQCMNTLHIRARHLSDRHINQKAKFDDCTDLVSPTLRANIVQQELGFIRRMQISYIIIHMSNMHATSKTREITCLTYNMKVHEVQVTLVLI